MTHRRYRSVVAMSLTFLMLLSLALVIFPPAAGDIWGQESDTDFSGGELTNVEIIGTGPGATVQLKKDILNWVTMTSPVSPTPRQGHAMAYDSLGGNIVLFGGYNGTNHFDDTWEYDYSSDSWTQIVSASYPSARQYAGMVYDSANERVVLFGGMNATDYLNDTWEYNVNTNAWAQVFPAFPPGAMLSLDMVYDSENFRTVIIGRDEKSGEFQTWAYRADTDTWLKRNPPTSPTIRSRFALAFHEGINRTVLYGGINATEVYEDTWEYDYQLDTWTQTLTAGPDKRAGHALAYHSSNASVLLYGGMDDVGGYPAGTYRYYYEAGSPNWSLVPAPVEPGGRTLLDMEYDIANDVMILFGGYFMGTYLDDTWALGLFYQSQGSLTSSVFDSLDSETDWGNIWWNLTPGAQLPDTYLRFQIATRNYSWESWFFMGPDGTPATYYETTPGEPIYAGQRGRYLRYSAILMTFDPRATPIFDDITITYNIVPASPVIIYTDPYHPESGVEFDRNITIVFNEPMNTSTVNCVITPSLVVTEVWTNVNTTLTLTHSQLFKEAQLYQVSITGKDLDGNDLQLGPVENPFFFITMSEDPTILLTDPTHLDEDVPLAYPINVTFSETMNASSVNWTIDPDIGLSPTWYGENTTLLLSHAVDFSQCTWYTVTIAGRDLIGNDLGSGPVPNPWQFKTLCLNPFIAFTDPANGTTGVDPDYPINVTFSEEMNITTLQWNITPYVELSENWQPGNMTVIFDHATNFTNCTTYTMDITYAEDLEGKTLIPGLVPNPWIFTAVCPNPQISWTDPYDGEENVEVDRNITVQFSTVMDTTTVKWETDPPIALQDSWLLNQVLTLSHVTPFGECTDYEVNITQGNDTFGNPLVPGPVPNPWIFNTTCTSPVILNTVPADGDENVLLNADIVITFSEEMNTTFGVNWSISPDPGNWNEAWEAGNTVLRLSHGNLFNDSESYQVRVDEAKDLEGNDLVPGPVLNPWSFTTIIVGPNPQIIETVPANGISSVPLDQEIIVNFSEPMDTGTVSVSIAPSIVLDKWWSNGNQTLTLTHAENFSECTEYNVSVTGKDMDGFDLVPGPVPNPFVFATICISPYIVSTFPADGSTDVGLDIVIQVLFSESMDVGTVNWTIVPYILLSPTWANENRTLFLDHVENFTECTPYTVTIVGNDTDGNPLIDNPLAPNPWTFTTECINPFIVETDPIDGDANVQLYKNITITFSEEIDTTTFKWIIDPGAGLGWTKYWFDGNTKVMLNHSGLFTQLTTYTVTVTQANDTDGYSLVAGPAPNPWSFTTLSFEPPYIVWTNPWEGAFPVPLDYNIKIKFSEPMNRDSVNWTIEPPVGGVWTESWEESDTLLNLSHETLFTPMTWYEVNVTSGKDLDGLDLVPGPAPNPWKFLTGTVPNPYIVETHPVDGETGVALDANITIIFSEEIDTTTFNFTIDPDPGNWTPVWLPGNTVVNLTHLSPFAQDMTYMVTVTRADDVDGNPLIPGPVPNPWNFTTRLESPYVVSIDPFDGQTGVAFDAQIIVRFSEPMDPLSVNWTINPDPGGWLPDSWSPGFTILTLTHFFNLYEECKVHQFTITAAKDVDGYDLVPLPFSSSFTTACINPYITFTDPVDGDTNVPVTKSITVTFNESMNSSSVKWSISPIIDLQYSWQMGNTTLILSHVDNFSLCQQYTVTITEGYDLAGLPLVLGPVPNPWSFTTECVLAPPSGLEVVRAFPDDVDLIWNGVPGASSYHVYESSDRFALFPSGWSMIDWPASPFTFPGHLTDGLTHYYIVRAYNSSTNTESGNSTMGVKIQKDFTYNPLTTNIYWISLPYNSIYKTASDITDELTKDNIRVVGKWDRITQRTQLYYYLRGKWRGNDFNIDSGDGIYVSTISTFSWYITGTDRSVILSFTYGTTMIKTNIHWISIPYTGTYSLASRIVTDIEGGIGPGNNTKIIEVGKWDPSKQDVVKYIYTPTGWSGDFNILPGDGIYLKVVTNFDWEPKLITPEVP